MRTTLFLVLAIFAGAPVAKAADPPFQREYHVSLRGDDANDGSASRMLKTISAAALRAQPGDAITVHAGVYRERINPPRGGVSDAQRIVYQAAPGEKVEIKGSEVIRNWEKVQNDTWKVTLTNGFFGTFNPYSDLIHGDWLNLNNRQHHTGEVYLNGDWLIEATRLEDVLNPVGAAPLWFGQVDKNTTIWAQFKGGNPNEQLAEINVRQAVFYPDKPGRNYITVRGFTLRHAATPWAPPTAEQVGLLGTHWSKGWIIENNTISHSKCSAITLGKYGDDWDNRSESAEGYVGTYTRALKNGWNKETVGSHVVRNNHISHCEQAGIVGSLGCSFSTVTGNTIHDIHVRRLFSGAEMAGIKFHGPIDVEISRNHIYRCGSFGIWLDWMAQGARVTGNLLHDNQPPELVPTWMSVDLFLEVNHGPCLVDNNIFLSRQATFIASQGTAYAHNLLAGTFFMAPADGFNRQTPIHKPHSTELAGMHENSSGDDRYYNNLFGGDVSSVDAAKMPVWMAGNVFLKGCKPSKHETAPLVGPQSDPQIKLAEEADGFYLELTLDKAWGSEQTRKLVTTELLGKAAIPQMLFENPDGTPIRINTDYFGKTRAEANPFPGPFELPQGGKQRLKVWPIADR